MGGFRLLAPPAPFSRTFGALDVGIEALVVSLRVGLPSGTLDEMIGAVADSLEHTQPTDAPGAIDIGASPSGGGTLIP